MKFQSTFLTIILFLLFMANPVMASVPGKIFPTDGAASDYFGQAVSVSVEYAIVGAHNDDDRGSNSGAAYIYQQKNNVWEMVQKIVPADGAENDQFGYAVSISGDYAIIGAKYDDDKATNSGSAYIYQRNGDQWELSTKLVPNDGAESDYFGHAVSIADDIAIVGAYCGDGKTTNTGSAYIYQRNGDSWNYITELFANDGEGNDYFGQSVSVYGDYAIIGAYGDDDTATNSGAAYIFQRNGTYWNQVKKLVASDGDASDSFGYRVSIFGDYAIIGAHNDDDKGSGSGAAYIYQRSGSYWNQVGKLVPGDGNSNDNFGYAVSIYNDYAVVGAHNDDDKGSSSGSTYIYQNIDNNWQQIKKLVASDGAANDYFANAVALSEKYAIIGAMYEDAKTSNSGSAYIYQNITITGQIKDPEGKAISGVSFKDYPEIEPTSDDGNYSITTFIPSDNHYILPQKTNHAFFPKYLDLTSPDVIGKNTSIKWEGHSVSVSDNTAIVGLPEYSLNDYNKGAAIVYTKGTDQWTQQALLKASDATIGDRFGEAVAIYGNYAIVSAPFHDYTMNDNGAVYMFMYQNNSWQEIQKLESENTFENQQFGDSVTIGEKYAFVSSLASEDQNIAASVHVFVREDSNWKFVQTIARPEDSPIGFGCDIAFSNDWLAIGAWSDEAMDQSGAVYVYQLKINTWDFAQRLNVTSINGGDGFGASVSISNEYLIVGAKHVGIHGTSSGAAFIFQQDDSMNWNMIQEIVPQDGASGDLFGADVAICDDYAVVGAYGDDDNGMDSGSVYLINRSSDRWLFTQKLFAPHGEKNDHFGFSVSISQTDAVVGSPLHDADGIDSGKVYMFPITHYTISGIIRDIHGNAIPGVKVSFTNAGISVYTNSDGFFRAKLYEGWEGKVCPQGMGYEYVPSFLPYAPLNQHYLNQDFTGIRFTIAGTVRTTDNQPLNDVQLTFSPLDKQTLTNDAGQYIQEIDYLWDGILRPQKAGYTFTPEIKEFDMLTSNYYDIDFIATLATYTISGLIKDTAGAAIAGADVCFSDLDTCVISGTSGYYSAQVPYQWTGTVSATMTGYVIPSESHVYTSVHDNLSNQNFMATINTYVISGCITDASTGAPLNEVQLTGNDLQPVFSDDNGCYRIESVYGYTGQIYPQKQGYVFSPETIGIENLQQDYPNQDINGAKQTFILSGTIQDGSNRPVSGISLYFSGAGSTITDVDGNYAYRVPYGWEGRLDVFKLNYQFNPSYLPISTVTSDQSEINFVATTSLTPNLYVEPDHHQVSHESGSELFTVQVSPMNITWETTTSDSWIQLSTAAGVLSVQYLENTSFDSRTANIQLTANNDSTLSRTLTITQNGKPKEVVPRPDWQVVASQYEFYQTLTAIVLDHQNMEKNNSDDILAAFSGDTCLGTASPIDTSYGKRYFLQIWSNTPGETINFRYYDSMVQQVYMQLIYPVTFQPDARLGSVVDPHVIMITQNTIQISLNANWNWFSLNATTDDMSFNNLFASLNGKGERIVIHTGFAEYLPSSNTWSGSVSQLSPLEMGMLRLKEAATLEIVAVPVNTNETVMTLTSNWNWISYLPMFSLSLDEALNSIDGKAEIIVGQQGFSEYVDNNGWFGTLTTLEPFQGYKIKMKSSADLQYPVTFSPTARKVSRSKSKRSARSLPSTLPVGCVVDSSLYENQFTLTGVVTMNQINQEDPNDVLLAKCNNICRGLAQIVDTPNGKRFFLQVWGDTNDQIDLEFHDASEGKFYGIETPYAFIANNTIGSVNSPEIIDIYGLEDQIADLNETIAEKEIIIKIHENTIALKETLINSQSLTIKTLNNQIVEKQNEIVYWQQEYTTCQTNCISNYVLRLKKGWNLVSAPPHEGIIVTTPANMIDGKMYYYSAESKSYEPVDTFIPQKGHWIKVKEDCVLKIQ